MSYDISPIDENSYIVFETKDKNLNDSHINRGVIMQYTGLKEYGIEVYEDDIIRFTNEDLAIVKFFEGQYIVVGVYKGRNIAREEFNTTLECAFKTGVLVGNIYENPELLELTS